MNILNPLNDETEKPNIPRRRKSQVFKKTRKICPRGLPTLSKKLGGGSEEQETAMV